MRYFAHDKHSFLGEVAPLASDAKITLAAVPSFAQPSTRATFRFW
jgi:hypothetical protein